MKITPESRRKPKTEDEDEDVVLVLAPFNKIPKLFFQNVKVGTSELQHIIIRNPSDSRIEVCQFPFLYISTCICMVFMKLFGSADLPL